MKYFNNKWGEKNSPIYLEITKNSCIFVTTKSKKVIFRYEGIRIKP